MKIFQRKKIDLFCVDEIPNEETLQAIDEANRGVNIHGPYHSVEELFEDLDSDGE